MISLDLDWIMVDINTGYPLHMINPKFTLFQDGMWEFDFVLFSDFSESEQAVLLFTV